MISRRKSNNEEGEDDKSDSELESEQDCDETDSDYDGQKQINLSVRRYKPTEEEKHKLVNMQIRLRHTLLPQHTVETTAGTCSLKEREKEEFEQYTTLKTGTFSKHEDKIIKKNWSAFCRLHDWDPNNPKPFLQMRHTNNKKAYLSISNRLKFVQFLADGLPNRSLYSVNHRFRTMFDKHKNSRYKKEEDDIIINFIRKYKCNENERDRKFAELAIILRRTRASVWRRYRLLKKKHGLEVSST